MHAVVELLPASGGMTLFIAPADVMLHVHHPTALRAMSDRRVAAPMIQIGTGGSAFHRYHHGLCGRPGEGWWLE
jgi:hypothetical protein